MTDINGKVALAEIVAGLADVTDGPWEVYEKNVRALAPGKYQYIALMDWRHRSPQDDANALHIARLSPDRIRAIADYVAGLEKALEFYRDGFSYLPSRSQTGIDLSMWALTPEILEDRGNVAIAALSGPRGVVGEDNP